MKGLSPRVEQSLAPVRTYIMVSAPMGEAVYERSINTEHAIYDTRFASDYYRRLPDGRLLWGGRVSLFAHPRAIADMLVADAIKVYPHLAGHLRADFAWGGVLAYPSHKMPILGRLQDGLWCNTGFGGHGICPTAVAGEVMADTLTAPALEQAKRLELFRDFKPGFIGGTLAGAGAQLVYVWWRLRDQLNI
jgi:glycine/D-amino acid oxidase-like deaminating enzyme